MRKVAMNAQAAVRKDRRAGYYIFKFVGSTAK